MRRNKQLVKTLSVTISILITFSIMFIGDVLPSQAWSEPTLDGKLDDVYFQYGSITRYGDSNEHEATGLDYHPAAYLYVLEDENYVYVFYHQDIFYANDNSYGDNSIHWESRKNGKRNFADIWESDMGEFTFKDAVGTVVAHFYVDQLAESASSPSGYACGGFGPNTPDNSPWNDGMWLEGDTGNQSYFEIISVMDYNLNSTGYCTAGDCTCGTSGVDLLANSPEADDTYQVLDSGCDDWQWYNGWEMKVDKSVFGALGFGVVIGNHHNSPTKTCTNKQQCETDLLIPWSTIGDRVWHDLDGDGLQDSGEPGLQGVSVELIDPRDGSLLERQITDSNGEYIFEMLSHFYYIVQVDESTLPAGFLSTTAVSAPTDYHSSYVNNVCGDDCIQRDGATYTNIYYVPLDHPQDYQTADFGYRPSGAVIGDYVWSDADNDGLQDLGEPGIGGVEVELLDGNGNSFNPVVKTTTNAAGWYMFSNLEAGNYKVRVSASNFESGGPLYGYTYSPGAESSPSPTNIITLAANEAYVNADFGYYKSGLGSIGDTVWFDSDNDGTQDEGEDGAVGVTLALYIDEDQNQDLDPDEGPAIATAVTNSSGTYSFAGLELDQYYLVKVTDSDGVLDGFTITTYWGDDPGDPVDIDRYNNPAPVHLTSGEPSVTWADFGYNRPGTIGDMVFFDWDQDGIQDPGEIGVYGVTVDLDGEESDTTTTSYEGKYLFTERPSGDYDVEITIPTGYSLSTGTPDNPHSLSITGNESYLDADFGLYRSDAYSIGNLIWYDSDNDGYRDPTEPGIEDVTVALYLDSDDDGVLDPAEPLIHTTTTNSSGSYTFYGLLSDNYIVDVTDENGILSGYSLTEGEYETDNYSHVDPYPVTISGASVNYVDFGYYYEATLAVITSFTAFTSHNQVIVEWETRSEVGTVGFILYRQDRENGDFQRVHEGLLPGLLNAPQGGTYRFLDRGATPGQTYTYQLVEMDHQGTQHNHGPYSISTDGKKLGQLSVSPGNPYWRSAHKPISPSIPSLQILGGGFENVAPPAAPAGFRIFLPTVIRQRHPNEMPEGEPAKVTITQDGLYYLSAEDIADAMDLSQGDVEDLLHDHDLQILNAGQPIAYLRADGNEGIYFFGEGIESIYTAENVYWLIQSEGELVASEGGEGPAPLLDEESFTQVLHFEEDHHAITSLADDPESDYWFWDYFIAGDPAEGNRAYTFLTDGATLSGSAKLDVYLQGATDTEANPDHHVTIQLNDEQIGESWWNGTEPHHIQFSFGADLLNDGENTLEVLAVLDTGVSYSIFYLDSMDITYERYYRAVADMLIFPGQDLPTATVRDFSTSEILLFDITNAQQPTLITATTINPDGEKFSVSFEPGSGEKRYLAVSQAGLITPVSIDQDAASDLKDSNNQADYLLITTDSLLSSAGPLLTYRQAQGYQTMAVDLVDIYDEFNSGIANPEAIKDFLEYTANNWTSSPSYVVLFGTGTYDYKNNQGHGDNLVPTVLVSGLGGLFASDTYFADVNGDDGVPDFAIGRIPVTDSTEAGNIIIKIVNVESANNDPWTDNVFMLADDPDDAGDFPADSDGVAAIIPEDFNISTIYLSEVSIGDARDLVIDGVNSGAGFVNYIGHAGLDRLANEGLLMSSDAPSLTNGSMLPIMAAMTCVAGRFEIPGHEVLAETMLKDNDGGAISVWAPSGLSINEEAVILNEYLVQAIFQDGTTTLGNAVMAALSDYASGEEHLRYMLEIYNLLGDPALVIGWNQ